MYESAEDPEILNWWALTPAERFRQSAMLWPTFVALGGSLEPEPDPQSPFHPVRLPRASAVDGGQACILYGAADYRPLEPEAWRNTSPTPGRPSAGMNSIMGSHDASGTA